MKKKLSLNQLEVKSFITSETSTNGGANLNTLICLTGIYPSLDNPCTPLSVDANLCGVHIAATNLECAISRDIESPCNITRFGAGCNDSFAC